MEKSMDTIMGPGYGDIEDSGFSAQAMQRTIECAILSFLAKVT